MEKLVGETMGLVERFMASAFLLMLVLACNSGFGQAFTGQHTIGETKVFVFPHDVETNVCKVFEVYINISNVRGLQGFDFMLTYNTQVLDCVDLEEGDFLSNFGDTFIAKQEVNDDFSAEFGRIWLAVAILGKGYADGNGTLAVIRFNSTNVGESVLDIYSDYPLKPDEVKLSTCGLEAIPNLAIDGHVVVKPCVENPSSDPQNDPVSSLKADVNNDGFVDIGDLAMIARCYGSFLGNEHYDAKADLDGNGLVDIRDVTICALMFGQSL